MDLAAEITSALGSGPTAERVIGVEQEFVVRDGRHVRDFRTLIPTLALDGRRLDPGDANAVRCSWGGVITADGPEAEIAIPPVAIRPGFTTEMGGLVAVGAATLHAASRPMQLEGYSTHLSVQVDDDQVVRTARRFTASFALAQMLLLDRVTSPGLLVRPRRGRLELCGEYVTGDHLRGAALFAAASVGFLRHRPMRRPEAALRPTVEPARERFGFFVDRAAYGTDVYRFGRAARLKDGSTAQDALLRSWTAVRPHAERIAHTGELELLDAAIEGRRPLPLEDDAPPVLEESGAAPHLSADDPLRRRRRNGLVVEPVVATWTGTAYRLERGTAEAFVTIPRVLISTFLTRVDAGDFDGVLARVVAAAPRLPRLATADGLGTVGTYGSISSTELVLAERDVGTGKLRPAGATPDGGDRRNKNPRSGDSPPRPEPSRMMLIVAVVVALVVLIGGGFAVFGSSDEQDGTADQPAAVPGAPTQAPTSRGTDSSISYRGTMTTGGSLQQEQLGIGYVDGVYTLLGLSFGTGPIRLTRSGNSFTASRPAQTSSCEGPSYGNLKVDITATNEQMQFLATTDAVSIACSDGGSVTYEPASYEFIGSRIDGSLPAARSRS